MSTSPTVSVLMPVYTGEPYLAEALGRDLPESPEMHVRFVGPDQPMLDPEKRLDDLDAYYRRIVREGR